jgi:hypothetical protein
MDETCSTWGEDENVYKILATKFQSKRPRGGQVHRRGVMFKVSCRNMW